MLINERFKSPNKEFEKVFNLFRKKDYFDEKSQVKKKQEEFVRFLKKGDPMATKVFKQNKEDMKSSLSFIEDMVMDYNKKNHFEAFQIFSKAVNDIEMKDSKSAEKSGNFIKSKIHNNSQKYSLAIYSAIRKQKFNNYKDVHKDVDELVSKNESVNEGKTISSSKISMMGARVLNKISIGTIFDTEDGNYEITDYGRQANAFKEFEAEHNGKKVKVKLTAMYGVKLEVTDDVRSARFNKEVKLNSIILESVNEGKFDGIADLVKSLHFEMDPKTAEEKKIEIGYRQGEVTKRKQIEGGEYSLKRFRKEVKYGDGTYLGVFIPGSYDAAVSSLGDGPHAKKVKKVNWNQRKYDKWISDLTYDNDGGGQDSSYGFEMAQNAKFEPGLIAFVKRSNRGEDPLQRIQWDIEAAMESVVINVNEAKVSLEKLKEFVSKHLRFVSTSDEFDGTEGGLWASAEDADMYKGRRIYDYYSEDHKNYTFGVLNSWEKELNKRGYYSEYYDAGTVMIWEE